MYYRANVHVRHPAVITLLPLFARPLATVRISKQRGLGRLKLKFSKALFYFTYHALNLPAQGEMKIIRPEGPRTFPINCADAAFVNYARYLREGGYEPEVRAFFDRVVSGGQVDSILVRTGATIAPCWQPTPLSLALCTPSQ